MSHRTRPVPVLPGAVKVTPRQRSPRKRLALSGHPTIKVRQVTAMSDGILASHYAHHCPECAKRWQYHERGCSLAQYSAPHVKASEASIPSGRWYASVPFVAFIAFTLGLVLA